MKKNINSFQLLGRWRLLLLFLLVPFLSSAQIQLCAPATISATTSGYATTGYNQVYVLVNSSGTVVASSPTGTFTSVAAGNYTLHALNYQTTSVPANVNAGTNTVTTGINVTAISGGCMNSDFVADNKAYTVTNCACATTANICSTDPIIGTTTGYVAAYTQMYFLTDLSGNIIASNTTGNFGVRPVGSYHVYALNYNPANPPAPIATATNVSQIGSTDSECYNEDFLIDYKCVNVAVCACTPVCLGQPITVGTTGQYSGSGYVQTFLLTNNSGVVIGFNTANPCSFPTGSLTVGDTYRVYALNYSTTSPPNIIPIVLNTTDVDNISGGCYDLVGDPEAYKCYTITANPTNPAPVTQVDPSNNTFPGCLNVATNTGPFTSSTFTNTCVPPLGININARHSGTPLTQEQQSAIQKITAACSGSLNFSNAPVIYAVQCPSNGFLSLTVTTPTNIQGTITNFEAALYGPVPAGCPTISGVGGFVDCNQDNDNSNGIQDLSLYYGSALSGETFLVLIDTDNGTGDFTINGIGTALPISLLSFSGKNAGSVNLLDWITSTEVNSQKFELERSLDNHHFVKLGEVAAAGNSTTQQSYHFTDENPYNGLNFYRLRMIDNDGKMTLSNVVTLKTEDIKVLDVYPNPFQSELFIATEGISGDAQFYLYNALGQVIFHEQWTLLQDNKFVHAISIENLAAGTYHYRLITESKTRNGKLLKE